MVVFCWDGGRMLPFIKCVDHNLVLKLNLRILRPGGRCGPFLSMLVIKKKRDLINGMNYGVGRDCGVITGY